MKKIVILSTSLRQNSNSDRLAKEFARGAIEAGHEVTYIRLLDKNIHFCIGCLLYTSPLHYLPKPQMSRLQVLVVMF